MLKHSFPYSEQILQWVWNEQLFETNNLLTECGKNIHILNRGSLNHSDGPDFKHAKVLIDGLEWNGSVEIHLTSSGWKQHNHHLDENYENVILHVVTENNPRTVSTKSGSSPYTLNLLSFISPELTHFLSNIQHSNALPCAGGFHFISEEVFLQQIEKAHHEYLEKKVEDVLTFYSPSISQSNAWKQALIISVFDGFGISNNRTAMQKLAEVLIQFNYSDLSELQDYARQTAFGSSSNFAWNFKGCRPHAHPTKRVEIAVQFLHIIQTTPFEEFLESRALHLWADWCKRFGIGTSGHPKILFGTVYLPALYLIGTLYHSQNIRKTVLEKWKSYQAPIPSILLSKFKTLDISASIYQNKLGSVHQLNKYCKPKNCSECLVLKKAISS